MKDEMTQFDIPIVLIVFKRKDTVLRIIDRIREIAPQKIYLLSDEGRDDDEVKLVEDVRNSIEQAIDWKCDVIKNYAEVNRGVYANIALGAKWVFEREGKAIFLEDDNLPEVSFFQFCREMLIRYENDSRILWVCGTNYLGEYKPKSKASYMFTRHMLPCGWASWSDKFMSFYDFNLSLMDDPYVVKEMSQSYTDKRLYRQQVESIQREGRRLQKMGRFASWDHHMTLTLRANGLLGVVPAKNQIKNIGVDEYSIHGGTSMSNEMTRRFCGMDSYPIDFPLEHPRVVLTEEEFERRTSDIILYPLSFRVKNRLNKLMKKLLLINEDDSLLGMIKKRLSLKKTE